jgi:HD-like signal output (HDOD) protein
MSKTRILFVDDDANVLDGLRRTLRRQRDAWDMVFASSGAEALAQLAAAPFDVVVTDMQMSEMGGAILLEAIMASYPSVGRIVLSGRTDEGNAARVSNVAHQFLSKPVDAETLRTAVIRTCAARQAISSPRIRAIVASVGTLPGPSHIYMEITRAIASDEASARAIAAIVAQDPALSAKLLQLVNSSFFGLGRRVSGMEHAISLLGLTRLKSLIVSAQILDHFSSVPPIAGFSINRLLQRSVITAQLARFISQAELQTGDRPDQAYSAGLLHDVGLLVLAARQREGFREALRCVREDGLSICAAEQAVWGATHPEVGACLLELWGLPPRIVEGVLLHHRPSDTDFDGVCALTAVHAAAALWAKLEPLETIRNEEAHFVPELDVAYLARIDRLTRVEEWRHSFAGTLRCGDAAGQDAGVPVAEKGLTP